MTTGIGSGGAVTGDAASPGCVWNAAHDYRISPGNVNPNPDSCGDAAVWGYEHGAILHDPLSYGAMTGYDTKISGLNGLERWYDASSGTTLHIPTIGVNDTGSTYTSGAFSAPSGVMAMHPYAADDAVLSWTSPVTGIVSLSGAFKSLDNGGGSGITWYIDMGSINLASGSYGFGGSQKFSQGIGGGALAGIPVAEGTILYFIVAPAANGDFNNDSTEIDLTIQQLPPAANTPEAPITPLLILGGAAALVAGRRLQRGLR